MPSPSILLNELSHASFKAHLDEDLGRLDGDEGHRTDEQERGQEHAVAQDREQDRHRHFVHDLVKKRAGELRELRE